MKTKETTHWLTPADIFGMANEIFKEGNTLFKELDSTFDEIFRGKRNFPASNIVQTEKGVTLEMALPGFTKENIDISLDGDILTVSCKKEETQKNFTRREFSYNDFTRSFNISEHLDKDSITSALNNGVLTIEISKIQKDAEKSHKKKIPVT